MLLKLAWRNIWRNKRRTLITVATLFFAVILAVVTRSMQNGTYDSMIANVVSFYYGYLQVHHDGYWEERSLENSFAESDSLLQEIQSAPSVKTVVPRLESVALMASDSITKGGMVVGTIPSLEDEMTGIRSKITDGRLPERSEEAVLLTEGMASYLNLHTGDTLIIIGQGYHGAMAAGKFSVCGIVRFASPELNDQMVYLPLRTAQYLFSADGRLTSLSLDLDNPASMLPEKKRLQKMLGPDYEVLDWKTMMPDLVQAISADNAGGLIMIFVLYIIVAFGTLATLVMMFAERYHEFGILESIGMKKRQLALMVFIETIILSFLGALAGMIGAIPVVFYFYINPLRFTGEAAEGYRRFGFDPVLNASTDPMIFINQALIVFLIAAVLSLYPVLKMQRLKPLEAMRA
ncbi:MAG: ABC transporter permease [Lewinellaceae bacterium]|nr:ABC transporter permease [Lewinellaceae bacterium]MCB9285673.1 ABC transporter permease [Lewinellaceae bacterium]